MARNSLLNTNISIHVPAWGTTIGCHISCIYDGHFNPRSRVGNDAYRSTSTSNAVYFNPRSRVGNDLRKKRNTSQYIDFNPRSRVGNDCIAYFILASRSLFQSTFPRGERQQILTIFHLYIRISNPNLHFNITPFHIFYLIHFFWACFFQLFLVRIFWGFSVYFWFALYRNNT